MGRVKRQIIHIFANSQADVRYRMKRATDYKDYAIKGIRNVGKDALGLKEYAVALKLRRGKK